VNDPFDTLIKNKLPKIHFFLLGQFDCPAAIQNAHLPKRYLSRCHLWERTVTDTTTSLAYCGTEGNRDRRQRPWGTTGAGLPVREAALAEVSMKVSKTEYRKEILYHLTMVQVKKMLREGLISQSEYWQMNRKMKEKYHPLSDGLLLEIDLA
jgi:hypothetical protein